MPDEPDPPGAGGEQRELLARLLAVVGAKDAENAMLRVELAAERELRGRLELRIAELERRLGQDNSDSGMPSSKEPIGAKERRRAERRTRDASERERRKDRKPGGQPGHPGRGLSRDPDPDQREGAGPPAQCSRCGTSLAGAQHAGSSWAQVVDVSIAQKVTEWLLPMLKCPCCGAVTTAAAPPGAHGGTVSYGPVLNAAAILLSAFGNVPPERSAHLIGMLLGVPVSAGFADKANARLSQKLEAAGFDGAMQAALEDEPVLAADESPVNVLAQDADPDTGEPETGAPHVLVIRTPSERLVSLHALASRRAEGIVALLSFFTGFLITDGYTAYQQLLPQLAGIQQCCQHIIRRCRAVTKLGPGGAQAWAGDVITILRQAHAAAEDARSRGQPAIDPDLLKDLQRRYDQAVRLGITLNRLRTGTATATTPAVRSAAGCATTPARSGCSPPNSTWSGPATPPSARSRDANGTRPSPDTGTPSRPSPAGAASAATSNRQLTTALTRPAPSAPHWPANPGYQPPAPPSQPLPETTPVNGHPVTVLALPQVRVCARWMSCPRAASIEM